MFKNYLFLGCILCFMVCGCATTSENKFFSHFRKGMYFQDRHYDLTVALEEYKKAEVYLPEVRSNKYNNKQKQEFANRMKYVEEKVNSWKGERAVYDAEDALKKGELNKAEEKLREARLLLENNELARKPRRGGIGIGTGAGGTIAGLLWFMSTGNPGGLVPRSVEIDSIWDKLLKLETKLKEIQSNERGENKK